jgi:hypothetical protein
MSSVMKIQRLATFLSALLISSGACAAGLGWYPLSFNWEKYEKDLPQVRESIEACKKHSDPDPVEMCSFMEYRYRLDFALALKNDSEAFSYSAEGVPTEKNELKRLKELYADRYDVADARTPEMDEFIGWPVIKQAFELSKSEDLRKYLLLFKEGRSEWGPDQQAGCKDDTCGYCDWRCNEIYVLLRPSEVADFEKTLRKFLAEQPDWAPPYFAYEAKSLLDVLSETAKSKRALYFYSQD